MSEETAGTASSTIEITDYIGMLAPLGWVHQDGDDRGDEEALRSPDHTSRSNFTNDWRECIANCMMYVGEAMVRQNSCQSA
ncbi:hypothetical protein N658DRAFT_502337 [Parathielavia hyrcaniae]|uniref:Uncharacterized protein n=1 Tax=Parathielavia hyrcaniae TaxID=113614 RepID=A0AAN6PPV8_9PEZI|nr:hypothetical protein N658DRAFT_502337 [Parathielavia hyrcaniae]